MLIPGNKDRRVPRKGHPMNRSHVPSVDNSTSDEPAVTSVQDQVVDAPAGLQVIHAERGANGSWSLPRTPVKWMKDPASRFLVEGQWLSLDDVDARNIDLKQIEAVAGKPTSKREPAAGEELSPAKVLKEAKDLLAWSKEHLPYVINQYEMISSEGGRRANLAVAWEKARPGVPVNAAIVEEAHRLAIKSAQKAGRYENPRPYGEQVQIAVDAAINSEEWEHVGAAFLAKPTQQEGESVVEMVRRSIKHREGLVREMLTALAAEEGADPSLASEEVARATYTYLYDDALWKDVD